MGAGLEIPSSATTTVNPRVLAWKDVYITAPLAALPTITSVSPLTCFRSSSRLVPVNLLARVETTGSPGCGATADNIGGGPDGLTVVEYKTGTLAARALLMSDTIAGTVAGQAGLGWHTAELISNTSNAVVPAASVTGAGAGISGSVLAPTVAGAVVGTALQAVNATSKNAEAA